MGVVKENGFLYIVERIAKRGFIYRIVFPCKYPFLIIFNDLVVSGGKELAEGSDFLLARDMPIGVGTLFVSGNQLF